MDRRGTILLVEDDPNDVALTQLAFEQARFTNPLQVVGDGEQAIAYLAGRAPYADRTRNPWPILVLLDLKLPRASGFEVLTWIRSVPNVRRLPGRSLLVMRNSTPAGTISTGRLLIRTIRGWLCLPKNVPPADTLCPSE